MNIETIKRRLGQFERVVTSMHSPFEHMADQELEAAINRLFQRMNTPREGVIKQNGSLEAYAKQLVAELDRDRRPPIAIPRTPYLR